MSLSSWTTGWVDAPHGCLVRSIKVGGVTTQADPAKGAVPVIKDRSHDIFKIRGIDKAVLGINAVFGHFSHARVKYSLEKGVAIVKEKGTLVNQSADGLDMAFETLVHKADESVSVRCKQTGTLVKINSLGTVSPVMDHMA